MNKQQLIVLWIMALIISWIALSLLNTCVQLGILIPVITLGSTSIYSLKYDFGKRLCIIFLIIWFVTTIVIAIGHFYGVF